MRALQPLEELVEIPQPGATRHHQFRELIVAREHVLGLSDGLTEQSPPHRVRRLRCCEFSLTASRTWAMTNSE